MEHKRLLLILLTGLFFFFQSCKKNELNIENPDADLAIFIDNEINKDFKNLSFAVSKALSDSEDFRKNVKNEALKMFDGDYDILLKDYSKQSINNSKDKTDFIVKDLLSSYYSGSNQKNGDDIIEQLIQKYPDLQISIPVHAEEWDGNYIPKVAFIPDGSSEDSTTYLPGFLNGEEIAIDAVNHPDSAVIVIGISERMMRRPIDINPIIKPIDVSIQLSAITTESGIRLTWTITNHEDLITGYRIYRKKAGESDFTLLGTNYGDYNNTYDDLQVLSNTSYSYFVKAFNSLSTSAPSNTFHITAPNAPVAVASFDVTQHALNDVEARWTLDPTEYYETLRLSKRTIGVNSDYIHVGDFTPDGLHYYIDNNVVAGKKTIYEMHQETNLGESDYKYDFIQTPYRDINVSTALYVERIEFTNWDIESWYHGKPEFKITVAGASATSNTSYPIHEEMEFDFCHRDKFNNFNNRLVLMWRPGSWHEILSFNMVEYDGTGNDVEINFNAKYKIKNTEKTGFDGDGSISFKYNVSDRDEKCGTSFYSYYDPTTMWLQFPNYGAKIKVSMIDVNVDCDVQ